MHSIVDFIDTEIRDEILRIEPRLRDVNIRIDQVCDLKVNCAYISGSVVEGIGNVRSDIDIHMPIETNQYQTYAKLVFPQDSKEYTVEVNTASLRWVNYLCSLINSTSLDDYKKIASMDREEIDYYYLVTIGKPIINHRRFENITSEFSKKKVNAIREVYEGLNCQNSLALSRLSIHEGDLEAAFFYSQEAVAYAIDSFLAANGEGYPSHKFRFEKLERVQNIPSQIYNKAWKLRSLGSYDFPSYINDAMRFCLELGMDRFPPVNLDTAKYKGRDNVHMINIVNTDGCYLVDDRLFMMQLSLSAQHLWFLLDGKHTKEELYSLMSAKFDLSSENAVIVTNECLSSFKIYGLVKLDR